MISNGFSTLNNMLFCFISTEPICLEMCRGKVVFFFFKFTLWGWSIGSLRTVGIFLGTCVKTY